MRVSHTATCRPDGHVRWLLALTCVSAASAVAQPTITADNLPIVGDHVVIAICSGVPAPGDAGENVTWDMSGLTELEEQYFDFVAPSSTVSGTRFPDATFCGVSWDDSHSFYSDTSGGLAVEGYAVEVAPGDSALSIYSDPEQLVSLPYTYGTKYVDTFAGDHLALGFSVPFSGTLDFEADGYGTLILPTGTYENVVRYHFSREESSGGATQTKDQWAWVSADYRFWLLLMETVVTTGGTTHQIWYDKNPASASTPAASTSWGGLKSRLGGGEDPR